MVRWLLQEIQSGFLACVLFNFSLANGGRHIIGVSWTLVYEMYFYIIFAATLFLGSRQASALLTPIIIVFMLCMSSLIAGKDAFLSNPIVLEFCFGIIIAYVFQHRSVPQLVIRYGWLVGFSILCLAALYVPHDTTNGLPSAVRWAAWGLPASLVVISFLGLASAPSRWQQLLVLVGAGSYAIYLTHPFAMTVYARILKDYPILVSEISQLPFVPFILMVCVLGGIVAHILIERPLLSFVRKQLKSHKLSDLEIPIKENFERSKLHF